MQPRIQINGACGELAWFNVALLRLMVVTKVNNVSLLLEPGNKDNHSHAQNGGTNLVGWTWSIKNGTRHDLSVSSGTTLQLLEMITRKMDMNISFELMVLNGSCSNRLHYRKRRLPTVSVMLILIPSYIH
ncbi:hypothetical protein GMOD_00007172 [Pyrenophora seminiperda CCB06]|uniref:Uncharacterized protein n=1 Tax=Pyrenophora seminiperda CCB06 TaxID=1302712 RepID=A0A3M7MCQ6_9PLEO|nr:hypothetical protein GMOD_00007172 [Pyrenophora seminiperda CCB06]